MPYEWVTPLTVSPTPDAPGFAEGAEPIAQLHLWPYRSLPKRGFVFVIGLMFAATLLPLLGFLGSVHMWILALFGFGALAALWWFIDRSYRDGEVLEELSIWPDHITLTRSTGRGVEASWEANIYWVTVTCHKTGGPIPDYITLSGNSREVEIGAFLSDPERPQLYDELEQVLVRAKSRHIP
ncbi:MAG: DUF2244 domain-containing protein [Maritimibacter sp.]